MYFSLPLLRALDGSFPENRRIIPTLFRFSPNCFALTDLLVSLHEFWFFSLLCEDPSTEEDIIRINILGADNGVGLTHSTQIIQQALQAGGFTVDARNFDAPAPAQTRYDLNLFLERLNPNWFDHAAHNWLLPNQEWFLDEDLPRLKEIDQSHLQNPPRSGDFRSTGLPDSLYQLHQPRPPRPAHPAKLRPLLPPGRAQHEKGH